ncbi:hypothetical protein RHSIM_Rhsim08G0209800 [Rhododendron simsii]|uniref:Serine-rich protein-like protein n=1 Tax=Rhododendron simsii TaxID=118357 RepID=A0A834GKF6_RHOSS|nr:hypothetical protein RHSIM_Rhsim08G0209800 [Rhododendron simsii]
MADSWSRTKSSRPTLHSFQRSISPSGRFCSSSISSSISNFSSNGRFMSRTEPASSSSPSVRFSLDRPTSPSRSISFNQKQQINNSRSIPGQKKTCMCSPTTHPGSFRCSLHKNDSSRNRFNKDNTVSYHSNRLYARRSAMTNSLVRIGTVEGDLVKRALAALIRPSSHQQRRRADFQPRPSRLSVMSKAEGL